MDIWLSGIKKEFCCNKKHGYREIKKIMVFYPIYDIELIGNTKGIFYE